MKLSLAILSLVALGSTLPVQQANTEPHERRGWLGTAFKIPGPVSHQRRGWFRTSSKVGGTHPDEDGNEYERRGSLGKPMKIGGGIIKDFLRE
ncbi:hypothetical protein FPOA_06704 [Fusarium poae]|uniref:Uncharacterized protein n=1 Tax=Fusarium poae TaxID=36050 RepID=A0A1B8AII1_FUSPO|nr:hypothetical protein FPOA_06704 [Fusarium poae]